MGTDAPVQDAVTDDVATPESAPEPDKDPVVLPAIGAALHTTGRVVADANLRQLGRGFKALGRKLPRVRIERTSPKPETTA